MSSCLTASLSVLLKQYACTDETTVPIAGDHAPNSRVSVVEDSHVSLSRVENERRLLLREHRVCLSARLQEVWRAGLVVACLSHEIGSTKPPGFKSLPLLSHYRVISLTRSLLQMVQVNSAFHHYGVEKRVRASAGVKARRSPLAGSRGNCDPI